MIDLDREKLVPMKEMPREYPGKRPHIGTVHRHHLRGVRGVKLETVLVGGRRYGSREAILRFLARVNQATGNPAKLTSDTRQRQLKRVDSDLDNAGY